MPATTGKHSTPVPGGHRAVTRALTTGFVSVALVAVIVCVVLMVMLLRAGEELETVRRDGQAVQEGLGLALAVREHYVHEAHTVIDRDRHQVAAHGAWLATLRRSVNDLAPRVPPSERGRLEHLLSVSEELDSVFMERVLPAAMAADTESLRLSHREAERLTGEATRDADQVVHALNGRMDRARRRAQRASTVALVTGSVGICAILVMAVVFSFRIRSAILLPMQALADAALRMGRGEQVAAISPLGRGEIAMVAHAFDAMAAEIQKRERLLVESERMAAIGELAAGVAHEINNPVGIIRGYLRTILVDAGDDELGEELRIIDEEAEACQRIVEDLLAFARAPQLEKGHVEIGTLLEDVARRAERTGGSGPITVRAETLQIVADPVRVRQVVTNLLRNAKEASPPDEAVALTGEALRDSYRIIVGDRGPGIPEEHRERVFEPFRSDKAGGTGLGLAVCRSIAEAHGGSVEARAREGGGTEMVVSLPRGSGDEGNSR